MRLLGGPDEKNRKTVRLRKRTKKKNTNEDKQKSTAGYHSWDKQEDSTQKSKHTAGLPREKGNGGGAISRRLLVLPARPARQQLHPHNLLLSTTFSRKTASHYPEQGVCADGQKPSLPERWRPGATPSAAGPCLRGLNSPISHCGFYCWWLTGLNKIPLKVRVISFKAINKKL